MDLYKTYKLMKQRAKRRTNDPVSQELCEVARSIFYLDGNKKNILMKIQKIIILEEKLRFGLKCYGKEMRTAV